MKLRFEIELLSDYHVSAGYGSGATIDSALFRDSDGIPVLRGTTIAGLLRDGMRQVLKSIKQSGRCHDGQGGSMEDKSDRRFCEAGKLCPVCRILGCPSQAKAWQVSSARPVGEQFQRSHSVRSGVASAVVQRSSTDVRKRRTIPARLFNREMGTLRLRFRFDVTGPSSQEADRDAALIVAAARMVRRLGQARRRGGGQCIIRLVNVDGNVDHEGIHLQQRLTAFQKYWIDDPNQATSQPNRPSTHKLEPSSWTASRANATTPLRYQLILVTREPVLAAAARQSGNEIAGFGYIPGSAILGAFAGKAARRWDLTDTQSLVYQAFVSVFRRGNVVFPTLYHAAPSGAELQIGIPAPADLFECRFEPMFKDNGVRRSGHHSCLSKQTEFLVACPTCLERKRTNPLDRVEGLINLHSFRRFEPRMREEMHVQLDPKTQTAADGQLFSYLAIDAGQYYYGELQFESQRSLDDFKQLIGETWTGENALETSLRLGRASGRGYGLVDVAVTELPFTKPDGQPRPSLLTPQSIEKRLPFEHHDQPRRVTITFLSDTILADSWGRYRHTVDEQWLRDYCFQGFDVSVSINGQFADWMITGGFYSHIGLPRQREVAIVAGSSCGFDLLIHANRQDQWQKIVDRLATLERDGVGLRRHEGFGRIAFNHPVYDLQPIASSCAIPSGLRLSANSLNAGEIQSLMQFISAWELALSENITPNRFNDARWLGMGQWLMTVAPTALEQAIHLLNGLTARQSTKSQGHDEARPGDPNFLFHFRSDPLRDTNFFADSKKGLGSLRNLISQLVKLGEKAGVGDDHIEKRGAGLRMLGASLIEAAKSKDVGSST